MTVIKPLQAQDARRVTEYGLVSGYHSNDPSWTKQKLVERVNSGRELILIAAEARTIQGYAIGQPGAEGVIEEIFVRDAFKRRRGIEKLLISECTRRLLESGAKTVRASNDPVTLSLEEYFAKAGYQQTESGLVYRPTDPTSRI